jgi:hypothetical protein
MTLNRGRPCAEVLGSQESRNSNMKVLIAHMYDCGPEWKRHLMESSLTITSPCGTRILKVDSSKVFTMDNRTPSGWKSMKIQCLTIEEAVRNLNQSIRAFRPQTAIH